MSNELEKRFTSYLKTTLRGYANKQKKKNTEKMQDEFNEIVETKVSLKHYLERGQEEFNDLDVNYKFPEKAFSNPKYYEAMKKIDNRQKQALYLIAVDGLTIEEVAKILKTSPYNVKKLKEKANINFKKNLR